MECGRVLLVSCVLAVALVLGARASLPSYIHTCKRNDPHLEDCTLTAVEKLRPQLKKGIPELSCPPLEPLIIPEVVVAFSEGAFKAVGHDVVVRGASKFKINTLKIDLESKTIAVGISLQYLDFNANYDVDLKVGTLPIRAKGPLRANATGIYCEGVLHGKLETRKGVQYLFFPTVDIELDIQDLHVRIDNLFPDQALNDASNALINDNSKDVIKSIRPIIERTVGNVIIDIANKITRNIPYDELFPVE